MTVSRRLRDQWDGGEHRLVTQLCPQDIGAAACKR